MAPQHLKLKIFPHGANKVVRVEAAGHLASMDALRACIKTYTAEADYRVLYVDDEGDRVTVASDAELAASLTAQNKATLTYEVVRKRCARRGPCGPAFFVGVPHCAPRCGGAEGMKAECEAWAAMSDEEKAAKMRAKCEHWAKKVSESGACAGAEAAFAKCAAAAEAFAGLPDEEKAAKLGGLARGFAEHLRASGLEGPASWAAAAAEAFAAGEEEAAAAEEEAAAAERVAVHESLETAAAGAPKPVAEPSGATALGLDQVRIAVQESLATAAAEAAPAEETKEEPKDESADSWEAVPAPGKPDVISALRSLEDMGFTSLAGVDACLSAVAAHTKPDRSVDLNAAVADLVKLIQA